MKNIVSYICSFILSVILVFSLLLALVLTVANNFANPEKLHTIAQTQNINSIVSNQLEKYFKEQQNTTGIPAEVYMNAISDEYIDSVIQTEINNAFFILINHVQEDKIINSALETALSNFYSDYAESINHPKNAEYDEKLAITKENAYKVIYDYCDVYKFNALNEHGILNKIQPVYNLLPTALLISWGVVAGVFLLLLLANLTSTKTACYWTGISAIISGILGIVPCLYVKATDFLSSFTIKQAQVYSAYTGTLSSAINSLLFCFAIAFAVGAVLLIIYIALVKNKKYIEKT